MSHASQTAIAHITAIRFKKMPIPVPSLAEQHQIVKELQQIEEAKAATENHLEATHLMLRDFTKALT